MIKQLEQNEKKQRKIRKGQPIKNRLRKFVVMYLNIRGIKSKLRSLINVVEEVQPTMICITETHLMEKEGLEIEGYTPFRNDRNKDGGGIAIYVQNQLKYITTIVLKKKDVEEALWVTINNKKVAIRVGVIYAPQESRTSKEEYEEMYRSVGEQILIAKQKNQKLLLMGDFNCKIGERVKGNTQEVSRSGKDFLKMAKSNKLLIINESEKCTGIWTREEGNSKSVLDYMLIDKEDEIALSEMLIDEEKMYAPVRSEKNQETVTSDHNTMITKFNWIIDTEGFKERPKTVLTKKGMSKVSQEMNHRKLSNIWKKDQPFEETFDEWKDEVNKIAEKNKIKVKKQNKRKNIKILIRAKKMLRQEAKAATKEERYKLVARIKMVEEEIEREDQKQYHSKLTKVVDKLQGKKGLNIPNMWDIMKKLKKKKEEPPTAIKSKDGKIVEDPESIKERYLEHFKEILKNKPAETDKEKKQEELIELAFSNIMEIAENKPTVLTTREEICAAVKELKRNKCKDKTGWNNELVLETGDDMIEALQAMMNRMERERITPKQWSEMKIKAVGKPGNILEMDNKRGLFITDILSKVYEKVIKKRNDEKIRAYLSDYQTGGVKFRSNVDNIMITSEIIRQKKKAGKKCYMFFGDAVKCFDKLWLKDSLVELFKAGCEPQDIQMIYNLNRDTIIEVETPSGTTEKVKVGDIVKQGTVLGPMLCCVSTDQINKMGEDQERNLGNEYVAILIFMDDVMSAGYAEEIRKAIRNCKDMEDIKKFTFGLKKTKYLVMKTGREQEEVVEERVNLGIVTKTTEYKYVGFHLDERPNCLYHIEKKSNQINGQITALRSIANYNNVGSKFLQVRIELYESCVIQSMLHGLEAWHYVTKAEYKNLEKIQAKALCQLLEVPRSTPYFGLLDELGIWRIEERLKYRRIMYVQNILKSDERRLCKRVVIDQRENEEEDTLYQTTKESLEEYSINIEEIADMNKSELKKKVKEEIRMITDKMIGKERSKMTKLRFTKDNQFERKQYISTFDGFQAMQTLKTRLNMQPIYANYKADIKMERMCPYCTAEEDTTEHLIECNGLGTTILDKEDLKNTDNQQLWKMINERVNFNINNRLNQQGKGGSRQGKQKE